MAPSCRRCKNIRRSEYGDHMKWLIPWPGDWHILLNYQKALMKAYAGAGLTRLGELLNTEVKH